VDLIDGSYDIKINLMILYQNSVTFVVLKVKTIWKKYFDNLILIDGKSPIVKPLVTTLLSRPSNCSLNRNGLSRKAVCWHGTFGNYLVMIQKRCTSLWLCPLVQFVAWFNGQSASCRCSVKLYFTWPIHNEREILT
jgi:hypothetical protein